MNGADAGKMLKNINDKVDAIYEKTVNKGNVNININKTTQQSNNIGEAIKNWYGLRVPSYVPDISGKQIYKLVKLGWSTNQICAISGYSMEEAKKKYDTYVRNNV